MQKKSAVKSGMFSLAMSIEMALFVSCIMLSHISYKIEITRIEVRIITDMKKKSYLLRMYGRPERHANFYLLYTFAECLLYFGKCELLITIIIIIIANFMASRPGLP